VLQTHADKHLSLLECNVQVVGYGLSGDAYNSTAPCEDGDGALRSMRMALQDAGVQPSEVGSVLPSGSGS
jgi:3-oxoacyl-[acyl-carrier-protein] synthase II